MSAMLVTLILQVVLAVASFALPLRIVNQRLVAEKRGLLAELDQPVKTMLAMLHRCLDDNTHCRHQISANSGADAVGLEVER